MKEEKAFMKRDMKNTIPRKSPKRGTRAVGYNDTEG